MISVSRLFWISSATLSVHTKKVRNSIPDNRKPIRPVMMPPSAIPAPLPPISSLAFLRPRKPRMTARGPARRPTQKKLSMPRISDATASPLVPCGAAEAPYCGCGGGIPGAPGACWFHWGVCGAAGGGMLPPGGGGAPPGGGGVAPGGGTLPPGGGGAPPGGGGAPPGGGAGFSPVGSSLDPPDSGGRSDMRPPFGRVLPTKKTGYRHRSRFAVMCQTLRPNAEIA